MTTDPQSQGSTATSAFVEDLFLTDAFLIKGRIANKYHRLAKMLEDCNRTYVQVQDATMVPLRGGTPIRTPSVHVNREQIIFAHELIDTAGDDTQRQMASTEKPIRIRAFYSGAVQIELAGKITPHAYEPSHNAGRWYFIMTEPEIRGLNLNAQEEIEVLRRLPYLIVRKSKLAYIYDFS